MTTRTAKLYQGEDKAPIVDYTDLVIWEESEFGTRAHNGEGSSSNVVIRDPLGETGSPLNLPSGLSFKTLPSKSLFLIEVDSSLLFRGRVGIKNYSRDGQHVERYRQVDVSLHDTHWDLDHIFVHGYSRLAETDIARTQGIIASYLSGNGRPTTVLNGSNYISASNPVTLPAQEYNRTSPLGMLREIATSANKQFFMTGDTIGGGSLFYDGNDSTAYACPFSISDRPSEVAANPGEYFPPIWNVGAASTEDGSEQIDEVRYFYGSGDDDYVTVHSDIVHTQYGHASVTIHDDTAATAAEATVRANSILAHRRLEDRTYNVTIGPLTDAEVVQIKHGQTINIKARAIPDADDSFRLMRIGQCRYTTPVAGSWFAHLQLGRPWKMEAYSTGTPVGPKPPSSGETNFICGLLNASLAASGEGSFSREEASDCDDATHWDSNSFPVANQYWAADAGSVQAAQRWRILQSLSTGNAATAVTVYGTNDAAKWTTVITGGPGYDFAAAGWTTVASLSGLSLGNNEGTLSGTFRYWAFRATAGGGNSWGVFEFELGLGAYTPAPVGSTGSSGDTSSGQYAPDDHEHAHDNITDGGPYHMAEDVTFAPTGTIAATNVQAAIAEVASEAGSGSGIAVEEGGVEQGTGIDRLNFTGDATVSVTGTEATVDVTGGVGGGVTHTYVGYNTVGGTDETFVTNRHYMKKITLASAGTLVGIEAHIKTTSDATQTEMRFCIFEDNAGTPRYLLHTTHAGPLFLKPSNGVEAFRWFGVGLSRYLAAGDYWIGFVSSTNLGVIKKDTGGSDRYFTAGGNWSLDAGYNAITTTTDRYSIRASILT